MVLPIESSYPVITNPVAVRLTAALPAAGAWDANPIAISCAGLRYVTFYLEYTRGGAGGAVDVQLLYSPYAADVPLIVSWFEQSHVAAGILAAGVDTQSRTQREYYTYQATAAGIESFVLGSLDLGHTVERLQMCARESGAVGTPGNLRVMAVFNRGA